jgi:hypothetical protein
MIGVKKINIEKTKIIRKKKATHNREENET